MLAKVESTQTLRKQPVELANVIKQVIADLAPIAFKQDQQLSFHGESSRLWGDELLLGILFKNLLDNAIRYSGHSSQIAVELSDHDGEIEVRVSDTGAAIDDLTREKMFDNFYRANSQKGDGAG
ncbi:sensor histidine kinase, partial [Klebsiella pneumoniae]